MEENKVLMKQKKFIIQFLFWLIIIGCIVLGCKYLLPVLMPFVIAFLIATILNRPIGFVTRKLKINHKFTASCFVLLFIFLFGGLISLVVSGIFNGIQAIFSYLPELFSNVIIPLLEEVIVRLDGMFKYWNIPWLDILATNSETIVASINQSVNSISNGILSSLASVIKFVPGLFMQTVITIIATFFISMDYHKINAYFMRQLSDEKKEVFYRVKDYVFHIIPKFIMSYGAIMCLTFIELLIGFKILGVPYAALIALIIAVLDILPVLGTGGVLLPWAIFSLVVGNFKYAIGMVVIYLVITIIRNIVEPRLIGKQMGLHPVLTLASMLVGLRLFGFLGLFIMPLGLSLFKKLNDDGVLHILK